MHIECASLVHKETVVMQPCNDGAPEHAPFEGDNNHPWCTLPEHGQVQYHITWYGTELFRDAQAKLWQQWRRQCLLLGALALGMPMLRIARLWAERRLGSMRASCPARTNSDRSVTRCSRRSLKDCVVAAARVKQLPGKAVFDYVLRSCAKSRGGHSVEECHMPFEL